MFGMNKLLAVGALVAGLLLPAQAMAAYEAYTRVDLNLRVGPDTNYGVIDVIPAGYPVIVLGCLDDVSWCDVDFEGLRGWVAASYLVQPGTAVYLPRVAPQVGLPIISFSFDAYHDRHYRTRPWHRQRTGRWRGRDHTHRPRERRREVHQERRPRTERRERQRTRETRERPRTERRERQRTRETRERTRSERRDRQRTGETRERTRSERRERQRVLQPSRGDAPRGQDAELVPRGQ